MKTLLLSCALALLLTGAASAQGNGPTNIQLFYPFAAHGNAPAIFSNSAKYDYDPVPLLPLQFTSVGQGQYGRMTVLADGNLMYTPRGNFPGQDSFTYTGTTNGQSQAGVITVTDFTEVSGRYFLSLADIEQFNAPTFGAGIAVIEPSGSFSLHDGSPGAFGSSGYFDQYGVFDGFDVPSIPLQVYIENGLPQLYGFYKGGVGSGFDISGQRLAAGDNAGFYTAIVRLSDSSGVQTVATASVNVTSDGLVTMTGTFYGYPWAGEGGVFAGGFFTLYFGDEGFIRGQFRDIPGVSDFDGTFYFPEGEGAYLQLIGSRFVSPGPTGRMLHFTMPIGTAKLQFTGVDLLFPLSGTATVAPGDFIESTTGALNQLMFFPFDPQVRGSALLGARTGQFSGYFTEPQEWAQTAVDLVQDVESNVSSSVPAGYEALLGNPPFGVFLATIPPNIGAPIPDLIVNPLFALPISTGWTINAPFGAVQQYSTQYSGFPTAANQFAGFTFYSAGTTSLSQSIDFSGAAVLSFDIALNDRVTAEVRIDGQTVWMTSSMGVYLDQAVDTSYLAGGVHLLEFRAIGSEYSYEPPPLELANIHIFGPVAFQTTGTVVSPVISPSRDFVKWARLGYTALVPPGTNFTLDVLDSAGNLLAADVRTGADLSTIPAVARQTAISLRGNFSSSTGAQSPLLQSWAVTWQDGPKNSARELFTGVVLQKQNIAVGTFLEDDYQSVGEVILQPQ